MKVYKWLDLLLKNVYAGNSVCHFGAMVSQNELDWAKRKDQAIRPAHEKAMTCSPKLSMNRSDWRLWRVNKALGAVIAFREPGELFPACGKVFQVLHKGL